MSIRDQIGITGGSNPDPTRRPIPQARHVRSRPLDEYADRERLRDSLRVELDAAERDEDEAFRRTYMRSSR